MAELKSGKVAKIKYLRNCHVHGKENAIYDIEFDNGDSGEFYSRELNQTYFVEQQFQEYVLTIGLGGNRNRINIPSQALINERATSDVSIRTSALLAACRACGSVDVYTQDKVVAIAQRFETYLKSGK
jgi:hypothetical protein